MVRLEGNMVVTIAVDKVYIIQIQNQIQGSSIFLNVRRFQTSVTVTLLYTIQIGGLTQVKTVGSLAPELPG